MTMNKNNPKTDAVRAAGNLLTLGLLPIYLFLSVVIWLGLTVVLDCQGGIYISAAIVAVGWVLLIASTIRRKHSA
jgi:hypothetical protein